MLKTCAKRSIKAMNETKPVRCLVAVYNSNGEPDMFRTVVDVTATQRRSGVHYARARESAEESGYTHTPVGSPTKTIRDSRSTASQTWTR